MTAPLVSIVIPCYNAEKWVAEAVESSLSQSHRNLEVIVVDDGSTDNSVAVLQQFAGRIRWETGPNRGGCTARNRGVEMARGEWIQFLDADDLLTPTCVEHKLELARRTQDIPCCDLDLVDGSNANTLPPYWLLKNYGVAEIITIGAPQTAAPLHRKDILLSVGGFTPGLPCSQEYDLHLRLAIKTGRRFVSNAKIGVLIRPTPGSVSRSAGVRMVKTSAHVLLNAADHVDRTRDQAQQTLDLIAQRVISLARKLWRVGLRDEACNLAEKARSLSPRWHHGQAYRGASSRRLSGFIGFELFEKTHAVFRMLLMRKPDASEVRQAGERQAVR